MKRILLFTSLCLITVRSFSQEVPVDLNSGAPIIQVPLWTVTDHDLTDNVALYYDVSKLKLQQKADDYYGVGWATTGGGYVTREVRGLPDDINETSGSRRGWLYTNSSGTQVGYDIGNFTNSANSSVADCSDETADNTKLNGLIYMQDPEPDIYFFSAPGLSGSFVFDNSGTPTIRLIPYQDIAITYVTAASKIISFTIKTNDGKTYTFAQVASNTKVSVINPALTDVSLLKTDFKLYKTIVTYNATWSLTRVASSSGAYIDYTYTTQNVSPSQDVRIGIYNEHFDPALSQVRILKLYTINETITRNYVSTITGSAGSKVTFDYTGGIFKGLTVFDLRSGAAKVKEFQLEYKITVNKLSTHRFLKSVTELLGCERMSPYQFTYVNEDKLPFINFPAQDIWGYYNSSEDGMSTDDEVLNNYHLVPSLYVYPAEPPEHRVRLYPIPNYSGTEIVLKGANRRPSPHGQTIGSLTGITYPLGGILQLQYEANTYYDARAAVNQLAGGLRIKRINYFDGVNPSGVITNTYEYNDPVTGQSYGRLIDVPSFLLPVSKYKDPDYYGNTTYDINYLSTYSTTDQWKLYTIRSEIDLNNRTSGSPVTYQNVIVKRPGSGSVKFQYIVPATYGSTTTGQWTPATDKFARPFAATCLTMGIISGAGSWMYPYAPNPNFNHERGLLERKYEYNEAGVLVRDTYNEYQDIFRPGQLAPVNVWGLTYDVFGHSTDNIYLYGKYYLLTDMGKALLRASVTEYDVATPSRNLVSRTEFYYEGTSHRMPTRIKSILVDGTIYTRKMKYPLDFGTIAANSDATLLRIKDLQTAGRNSSPVEVVSYVQNSVTDVLKATSAELVKYETFSPGGVLPREHYALPILQPVTGFVEATQELVSGTYKFKPDSHYELDNRITAYTVNGHPVSSVGNGRIPTTISYGYNGTLPIATVSYATQPASGNPEFAFSDFEVTTSNDFTITNPFYGAGYTGAVAVHPYASLTRIVNKAANTTAYAVSFRARNNSTTPFSVRVMIKSADQLTPYVSDTIKVFPNTAFRFKRKSFPVPAAASTFFVSIAGEGFTAPAGSSASLLPMIDDVAFYPEQASMVSYTYQIPFGAKSVTNQTQGLTSFSEYDGLGRLRLTRDMDQNILQRSTYNSPKNYNLIAGINLPAPLYAFNALTITATDNPCIAGETYTWEILNLDIANAVATAFGPLTTNLLTYTFDPAGSYRITLKVNATGYTQQTVIQDIGAVPKPYTSIFLCLKGVSEYGCSAITTETGCTTQTGTATTTYSYFKVGFEDEVPVNPIYQWKKRNVGQTTWVNVGGGSSEYSFKVLPNMPSAEVMCTVSTANGRMGNSTTRTVTIYPCQ